MVARKQRNFYSHKKEKRRKLRRTGSVNSSNRLTGASNDNIIREANRVIECTIPVILT